LRQVYVLNAFDVVLLEDLESLCKRVLKNRFLALRKILELKGNRSAIRDFLRYSEMTRYDEPVARYKLFNTPVLLAQQNATYIQHYGHRSRYHKTDCGSDPKL
jgi:hypothetical protein